MSIQRKLWIVLVLVALLFSAVGYDGAVGANGVGLLDGVGPVDSSRLQVVQQPDGLEIRWSAGEPSFTQNGDGSLRVDVPGFDHTNIPGASRLPVGIGLVALPPGAQPELVILEAVEQPAPVSGVVEKSLQPLGVQRDAQGQVAGGGYAPAEQAVDFIPQPIMFEDLGIMRGVRLGRLLYYPVLPAGDGLRLIRGVQARLIFNVPLAAVPQNPDQQMAQIQTNPILRAIQQAVVNPQQVEASLAKSPGQFSSPAMAQATGRVAIVEINVDSNPGYTALGGTWTGDDNPIDLPGLVELSYEALQAISFPVGGVNPANLQLTHGGVEVAMTFVGDSDAAFEAGEKFQFISFPRFSRWSNKDTYLLREGSSAGLRMGDHMVSPVGSAGNAVVERLFEKNTIYTPDCNCGMIPAGRDGDHWVWDEFKVGGVASRTYSFTLPSVNPGQPASLTLWAISYTNVLQNPDHKVEAKLNNVSLVPTIAGSDQWDGKAAKKITFTIPANLLSNSNSLVVRLPGISDGQGGALVEGMWLDAYKVQYVLGSTSAGPGVLFQGDATQKQYIVKLNTLSGLNVFDVTDENQPQRLSGYGLDGNAVNLGDPAGNITHNYLLVTGAPINPVVHLQPALAAEQPGFNGADYVIIAPQAFISGLAPLISLRQNNGRTVVVEDVQAIYDRYSEGRLSPQGIYSYLVDAYQNWSLKPLHVLLVGDGTQDPKKYYEASFDTFIPPYLADVDPWAGETASDNRYATVDGSDILPDLLIGRLPVNSLQELQTIVNKITSYETSLPGGAWQKTALIVADNADDGGDFPADAETLATKFPVSFTLQRHYLPSATKSGLISSWNNGAKFISYIGHSSIHQWAAEELLHAMTNVPPIAPPPSPQNQPKLNNGDKLPVVLELTCFTGMFQTRGLEALDERLLRSPGAGAIAVLAPTGLGISSGHVELAKGFYEYAFIHPEDGIGLAILNGKIKILNSYDYQDLIDTYLLLGDSDLSMQLPPVLKTYVPMVFR
jgi:hypothetical protein